MRSLVRDVMTTEVVAVQPWTPFREIVARLAEHRISAAPVLDAEGNVLGVVSEADLLLKQEHPDLEEDVIVGDLMMDPSRFFIHVDDAMVVLQGRVERGSLIPYLIRAVHAVEGVIRVEDRLTFDVDDHDPGRAIAYPWGHRRLSAASGRAP